MGQSQALKLKLGLTNTQQTRAITPKSNPFLLKAIKINDKIAINNNKAYFIERPIDDKKSLNCL